MPGRDERRKADSRDYAVALRFDSDTNNRYAEAAEEFVAWQYGLETNPSEKPEKWDIQIKGDKRVFDVDVKWTDYEHGRLLHRLASRWHNDIYILVTGYPIASFQLRGFEWGHVFHQHIDDLGHGATYAMTQDQIKPNVDMLMADFRLPRTRSREDVIRALQAKWPGL